jgi:hypothetical protein
MLSMKPVRTTIMRIALIAAITLILAAPAAAQQSRAPSGFDFNICYSQCLSRGGSPGSCQPGCSNRAAAVQRAQSGGPRGPNDDPRSPRFYDPEPRRDLH